MSLTESDVYLFFASLDTAARATQNSSLSKPVAVRFDLGDAGSWTLRMSPTAPGSVERSSETSPGDDTSVDCTLSCALNILLDMANGRRKPAVAFLRGQIGVRGDRSLLPLLQPLIKAAGDDFKTLRAARRQTVGTSSSLAVTVHGASIVADKRESYAVYLLEVFEGDARWTLTRRWSEVRALERRLRRIRSSLSSPPPVLPRSLDFAGSLEQPFLAKRSEIIGKFVAQALEAVPTSVLMCTGESVHLRLFLSPGDLPAAAIAPTPQRPDFSSPAGSFYSPGRETDASGFDEGGRLTDNSVMLRNSAIVDGPGAALASQQSNALLSPGWRPLEAPALLSPRTPGQTRRIADIYTPPPQPTVTNDGVAGPSAAKGVNGHAVPNGISADGEALPNGLLLDSLLAAAACQPIRAEIDGSCLQARMGVLSRLRSYEGIAASEASTSLLRLVKTPLRAIVPAVSGCTLPAVLGILAATHGWALLCILCLARSSMYLAMCGRWERVVLLLCLVWLGIEYGQYALRAEAPALLNGGADGGADMVPAPSTPSDSNASYTEYLDIAALRIAQPAVDTDASAREEADSSSSPSASSAESSLWATVVGSAARLALRPIMTLTLSLPSVMPAFVMTAMASFAPETAGEQPAAAALAHTAGTVAAALIDAPIRSAAALLACCVVSVLLLFFGRLARVYSVGLSVVFAYWGLGKVSEALSSRSTFFARHENAVWSSLHNQVAPFVCGHFADLKSVFVKFGQYLGGRADVVPPEWSSHLKLLQDDLPACPPRYVRRLVQEEFGRRTDQLFEALDEAPIASASVAQVHVGTLKASADTSEDSVGGIGANGECGGSKVVLKVQHDGVEPLMSRDMLAVLRLIRIAKWLSPDLSVMYSIFEAWQTEMFKEFDFANEAENLREVSANLRRANVHAIVPRPVAGMIGRRAFAMSFEEGFKVTDIDALAMHSVDREALMGRIVQVYAQQLFVDGFFNADPHAGNIMVQVVGGRATPVLLDFGMTVRLTSKQRLGYARLAFAAQQMDINGLQHAVAELGIKNNQQASDPSRDLDFWRFFLRDTGGREEAKEQAQQFFARKLEERKVDKVKGDDTRKVEALPPSFVFFWRVIGLIRGLCATLKARVPYMDILAARAKVAIALCTPPLQRALTVAPPPELLPEALPMLQRRLSGLLVQLCNEGSIAAGVQVCVQRSSATLAECCAGFRGLVDPRGMRVDVPMPMLELSDLLPVLAVHQLVAAGATSYDAPLRESWPGCAAAATSGRYTVGDALCNAVPLDGATLWRQAATEVATLSTQLRKLAAASLRDVSAATRDAREKPLNGAGGTNTKKASLLRSSGSAHATLLAGIVEGVSGGRGYAAQLRAQLLEPLGLAGIVHGAALPELEQHEAAAVSTGFGAQLQRFGAMRETSNAPAIGAFGGAESAAPPAVAGGANGDTPTEGSASGATNPGGGVAGPASDFAHEIPLHAGMVNSALVRGGCAPGLAAFASARGICALLGAAARGETGPLAALSTEAGVEHSFLYGERIWVRGLQKYECAGGTEPYLLGLHSFCGSFAFLCPRSGASVAILLNDGQLDYSVTRRILDVISEELAIGQIDFLGSGLL